jgi:hypothetical protein
MSTKLLTKDLALSFILHASGPDFYLIALEEKPGINNYATMTKTVHND